MVTKPFEAEAVNSKVDGSSPSGGAIHFVFAVSKIKPKIINETPAIMEKMDAVPAASRLM